MERYPVEDEKMRIHKSAAHGLRCSNCSTATTSLWRRNDVGPVCNECGLHYNKYGENRPVGMDVNEANQVNRPISRKRKPKNPSSGGSMTPTSHMETEKPGLGGAAGDSSQDL